MKVIILRLITLMTFIYVRNTPPRLLKIANNWRLPKIDVIIVKMDIKWESNMEFVLKDGSQLYLRIALYHIGKKVVIYVKTGIICLRHEVFVLKI